jgi:hypothetical protein
MAVSFLDPLERDVFYIILAILDSSFDDDPRVP